VQIHAEGYQSYFLVQIHAEGYLIHRPSKLKFSQFVSIIKITDIYQCEYTDHVYAVVGTGLWATHMVCMGDLLRAGTMLVTPGFGLVR